MRDIHGISGRVRPQPPFRRSSTITHRGCLRRRTLTGESLGPTNVDGRTAQISPSSAGPSSAGAGDREHRTRAHRACACHRASRRFVYMVDTDARKASRRDTAVSTDEQVISRPIQSPRLEPIRSVRLDEEHPAPIGQEPRLEVSIPSLLWRLLLLAVGFGLALTGWMLVMSVFSCSSASPCSSSGWR